MVCLQTRLEPGRSQVCVAGAWPSGTSAEKDLFFAPPPTHRQVEMNKTQAPKGSANPPRSMLDAPRPAENSFTRFITCPLRRHNEAQFICCIKSISQGNIQHSSISTFDILNWPYLLGPRSMLKPPKGSMRNPVKSISLLRLGKSTAPSQIACPLTTTSSSFPTGWFQINMASPAKGPTSSETQHVKSTDSKKKGHSLENHKTNHVWSFKVADI